MLFAIGLLCLTSHFTNAQFPTLKSVTKDYRTITIEVNDVPNYNSSGLATEHTFVFQSKIVEPSIYKDHLRIIFKDLPTYKSLPMLLNNVLSVRFALRTTDDPNDKYSPWQNFTTKDTAESGADLVPGKVLNLAATINPDASSHHKVIITFDTPSNIQSASNPNNKSIQYRIEECKVQYITNNLYECKQIAEMVSNTNKTQQSTEDQISSYSTIINPPTNKVVAFKVTAISLKGDEGEPEQLITRLDPSTEPDPPVISLKRQIGSDKYILVTRMEQCNIIDPCLFTYYMNIKGDAAIITPTNPIRSTTNIKEVLINENLRANTDYEIKAMLTDGVNGTSKWSPKVTFKTALFVPAVTIKDIGAKKFTLSVQLNLCSGNNPCKITYQFNEKGSPIVRQPTLPIDTNQNTVDIVIDDHLKVNTEYEIKAMQTFGLNAPSSWSKTVSFKTKVKSSGNRNALASSLIVVMVMVLKMFF